MNRRLLAIPAACCAVLLATAACGDGKTTAPAATLQPATATLPPARAATPLSPAPTPAPPPATPSAPAVPLPTPPAGSRFEPAPIDGADLLVEASNPAQYAVKIKAGLPSGCHVFDHTTVTRSGSEVTIGVFNRLPADAMRACTAIYGIHETTVQLGSDFASGATYRVHVNDRTIEFTAQ